MGSQRALVTVAAVALLLLVATSPVFLRNQKEPEAPAANLLKIKEKAKCQRLQEKTGEQRAKHCHSHSHRTEISGNTEGEKEN